MLPELDLLLDDGEGELDVGGVDTLGSDPADGDGLLVLAVLVGHGGLRVVLAASDVLSDLFVDGQLADEVVTLLGVDQEPFERGGAVLGLELLDFLKD